jgi:ribosomal protein S18 acetylase RimI-like enzyme
MDGTRSGDADRPRVRVVRPGPEDADELASVQVRAWRETYARLLPERFYDDLARERRREMWTHGLAHDEGRDMVRVARLVDERPAGDHRADGPIIGFAWRGQALAHQDHPPVRKDQLFAIYVLAAWHGLGIGQALLDECLGSRPAQLWVARDNTRARSFYRRNGFVEDGTEQIDPDLDGLVEVRMVR